MGLSIFSLFVMVVTSSNLVFLEADGSSSLRGIPPGWSVAGHSSGEEVLELMFAVRNTNLEKLEATALRVSDPLSKHYGQYLSNEAVHSMIAPAEQSLSAIVGFLAQYGLQGHALTPNSDFLQVTVTVAQANSLLSTEYYRFTDGRGRSIHRCLHYSLPAEVARHVDFVAPTVHIPKQTNRQTEEQLSTQRVLDIVNTPKALRNLYSVGDAIGVAPSNSQAVTAFLKQFYHKADLEKYWADFCQKESLVCGKGLLVTNGDGPTGLLAGVEAMLDIQTITSVAGNISSEFWGFSGVSPDNQNNEPFLKWLTLMDNTSDADIPKVFSTSYGEDEDSWSLDAATRLNVEFQKAASRGLSLLYASGDSGANCNGTRFVPQTPGSSPWVTAVGGTKGGKTDESAISLSSGGFSDRWPMPDWQVNAVKKYLGTAKLPPASAGYNTSGRAYPDIAAQASGFNVVANGVLVPGVAGTSCAAPTASAIISLLNDLRLQAGKPVLGFLNPWIYQNIGSWNDIVLGSSGGGDACGGNWEAAPGWDAATGVGTPNYAKLSLVV